MLPENSGPVRRKACLTDVTEKRLPAHESDQRMDVVEGSVLEDSLNDPQRTFLQVADIEILVPEQTLQFVHCF